MHIDWTPTRLTKLKQLFDDGYSGATMAEQLAITRTAALRKCELMGWKRPTTKAKTIENMHGIRRASKRHVYKGLAYKIQRGPQTTFAYVDPISDFDKAIPIDQRRSLLDLKWNECRYPVGTPGSGRPLTAKGGFFCGAIKQFGSSYCLHHHKVVWVPSRRV